MICRAYYGTVEKNAIEKFRNTKDKKEIHNLTLAKEKRGGCCCDFV